MSNNPDFRPRFVDDSDQGLLPSLAFFTALAAIVVVYVATAPPTKEPRIEDLPPEVAAKIYQDIPTVIEARASAPAPIPEPRPAPKVPKTPRPGRPEGVAEGTRPSPATNPLWEAVTHGRAYTERYSEGEVVGMIRALPGQGTEPSPTGGTRQGEIGERVDRTLDPRPPGPPRPPIAPPKPPEPPPVFIDPMPPAPDSLPETCVAGAVQAVVKANRGQLKGCYEGELRRNPSLSGMLDIVWTVKDGHVVSAHTQENTTGSSSFAACVERRVSSWRFDAKCSGEIEQGFMSAPR